MADYPTITQLSQVDSTTPADTEVANKLDDAIRQIKGFLVTYLGQAHDDTGALKTSAVATGSIADGSISTVKLADLAVTAAKLAVDAVETAKIKDLAVTTAKLADSSVTSAKIVDGTIVVDDLADNAVETAKLADDAVDATKLKDDASVDANRAVTTNHIRDSAVTNAKLAANAVTGPKIDFSGASDAAPQLMAGGSAGGAAVTIGGVLTASIVGSVLTFALGGASGTGASALYARIAETKASGVDQGAISAGDNERGPWSEERDPADFIGVTGNTITFKKAGTYLVWISAPGYSNGGHRCLLKDTAATPTVIALGQCVHSPPGVQSRSELWTLLEVANDNTSYKIHHHSELAKTVNGKGLAVGSGQDEVYAVMQVFQLLQQDTEA